MPAPPLLKRPAPAPYFHPLFSVFQISPLGEVIKIYSPLPLKKRKGRGSPNYGQWAGNLNDSTCVFNLTICLQNNSLSYDMSVYDPTLILGGLDNFEVIYFLGAQLYWNFSKQGGWHPLGGNLSLRRQIWHF